MAEYVVMAKYTPAALAAVREAGYASRVGPMRAATEAAGGTFKTVVFLDSGEWDFIATAEGPSGLNFMMGPLSSASGAFEKVRYFEARTAEEMDAISRGDLNWTAPGTS